LYSEEELPPEFKLFLPIQKQQWRRDWSILLFIHPPSAIHHIQKKITGKNHFNSSFPLRFYQNSLANSLSF
jgi:hypothetical protein